MTTNYIYDTEEVHNEVNNMNTKVNSEGLTLQSVRSYCKENLIKPNYSAIL